MDPLDLYGLDEPSAQDLAKALARQGRERQLLGLIGQLSGDRAISPVARQVQEIGAAVPGQVGDVLEKRAGRLLTREQLAQKAAQMQAEGADRKARLDLDTRRVNYEGARLGQDAFAAVADPVTGGIVMYNKKTGQVRPLGPGGGTPAPDAISPDGKPLPGIPGKPTEKQRNAVLGSSSAMSQIDLAMRALKDAPTAYGGAGNVAAGIAEMAGGETAQSLLRRRFNPKEQRAKNIVDNVVSTIINERAGANVSLQELLRQSFLPKATDSYDQALQKLQDLRDMTGAQYEAQGAGMVPAPGLPVPAAAPAGEAPRRRKYNPETEGLD